jgi:hypothetical protein
MAGKTHARDVLELVLATVMAVCLSVALVAEAGALVWNGQPLAGSFAYVAGIFAWAFAAAFFISFGIAIADERARVKIHRAALSHEP